MEVGDLLEYALMNASISILNLIYNVIIDRFVYRAKRYCFRW